MCAILGVFNVNSDIETMRRTVLELTRLQRHRGPDWSGIYTGERAIIAHERLAIVGVDTGAQPLYSKDGSLVLGVNGEIYNHKELEHSLTIDYSIQTKSDCEVILAKFMEKDVAFLDELRGMFAFVLYDEKNDRCVVARDHIGIVPLYYGYNESGALFVSSEMKSLLKMCKTVQQFPPGHYLDTATGEITRYYRRSWESYDSVKENTSDTEALKDALESAVKSHLMSDVPYGVLISGGLDSSIVAAVAKKFADKRVEDDDRSDAWWPRLHSFAIGLEGAPDLVAAQKVADFIGTVHHEIHFTVQEGLDAISDVIWHIETYDVTTIRASTPMYLMARKIKAMGIKMVLSGEGADEIFGGYLYFHKAPDARSFHEETVRKLSKLYMYDCLRANKAMAAWGVEARVPFLDKVFMDTAMTLNPEDKRPGNGKIEKHILRQAFENSLPEAVLWRQKEQFSDGVGYSWIDGVKAWAAQSISDTLLANAQHRFPVNTPDTKEAYLYREIFEKHFPTEAAAKTVPGGPSVACSTAEAIAWDESFKNMNEPSGRAIKSVHEQAY